MLIDVHSHFYTERSGRADWREVNARRISAGDRIGITGEVASILGTWGAGSPTYLPSPDDVTHANDRMLEMQRDFVGRVFGYCVVNPNYPEHAQQEIRRRLEKGMVGIKLAASRRANDPLLDAVAALAAEYSVPILHHVWQHRRREWPGQEASDAGELAELAERHPNTRFILAHLGGGGDWAHTLRALRNVHNVWVDVSGSGVDVDMIDRALETLGSGRLLWGTDVTMATGWGKLRYLATLGLSDDELGSVRSGNAIRIFPPGVFSAGD
ncbi:MAG: amidohydrolase family protein [Gemmatimonadales bacterium]|nr:amidohydrolase family protein [Gemmatimonadales bacterium]NIN13323.1 amidohydrolase family protein [Gemmatimonadales bacterium]NIN51326.1 amidohydrolase family protein [Gemmatimonadales bacterium]NIP08790.1 amidohydrolase family protein [Gemmatimonadales bacterium]NIQ99784.1 amidohydrolase family protein [Gemmatimonadales bacterium]